MRQTGVLVAGGGPVGLCLALLLAEKNIDVTVVEAAVEPARDLRASTFHPPTLDMLDRIGIGEPLIEAGLPCPDWQIRLHPSGEHAVFRLAVLADDTNHPYRLQCEQWQLTELLRARLVGRADVLMGTKLVSFSQDFSGVLAEIEDSSGRGKLAAKFLAGCDGVRSTVRAGLGLYFEGDTYPETTLLATTTFPFQAHLEGLSNVSYCWREGPTNFSLLRMPDRWRVSIYPLEDYAMAELTKPAAVEAALQAIVAKPEPYVFGDVRPYRVHMRMVEQYVSGRVALAGDAAHINAPAGGMGLNGGLHDAFELAAALAAASAGKPHEPLLDRYDRRRRPVARDEIVAQADRNRARGRERDPIKRRKLLAGLRAITADPVRMRNYLLHTSMIDGLARAAAVT